MLTLRRPPVSRWLALSLLLAAPTAVLLLAATIAGLVAHHLALILLVAVLAFYGGFGFWYTRTVRRALSRAEEILGDEPRPSSSWDAWTMLGELDATVERLRRHLLSEKGQVVLQASAGDAVLNALPDPILVLDSGRRVTRANQSARTMFGDDVLGQDLAVALRHPVVLEAADDVLAGRAPQVSAEFAAPTAEGRSFTLRVVALQSPDGGAGADALGMTAVLALHDVTALDRAERMRADFVANASHELRTPLASLVGFIETLQGPARDDEPARLRFLGIMRDQAARMARLINDLLSLSQIEMREHDRPKEAVPLAPLLQDLTAGLEPQAARKGVRIHLKLDADLPPALGARDELMQVFQNLIDNAVKYGRNDTRVDVSLRRHDDELLEVAVSDQGEGIPKQHLPRLTERFYRVDSARSRELGGTGLGLAIVKHIVSRHRGRLIIESEVGVGSKFIVRLPIVH